MSTAAQNEPPLILLIDDDLTTRMHLRLYLENEGYRIAEAKDGREGLTAYSCLRPDMVLLDALMPDIDGFECCAQLQNLPGGNHTPVLIITSLEDQKSVDKAFEVGAADYVTKPVHWAVLRQRVRRLIQQAQLQQQLKAANRELRRQALVDGLTQVGNRRRFDDYLSQEWRRMQREQLPLSLILCDIDCFKPYNDTYGHLAGDRCLQQVAKVIQETIRRPADFVARYGGEEFAVILPHTNQEGAVYIAETLCGKVKALAIPHSQSLVNRYVTISAGVVSILPSPDSSVEFLITAADKALYQAKNAGRNQHCLYIAS
jgi:diguanylate cyclase (GGDEF)-like protein